MLGLHWTSGMAALGSLGPAAPVCAGEALLSARRWALWGWRATARWHRAQLRGSSPFIPESADRPHRSRVISTGSLPLLLPPPRLPSLWPSHDLTSKRRDKVGGRGKSRRNCSWLFSLPKSVIGTAACEVHRPLGTPPPTPTSTPHPTLLPSRAP